MPRYCGPRAPVLDTALGHMERTAGLDGVPINGVDASAQHRRQARARLRMLRQAEQQDDELWRLLHPQARGRRRPA